MLALLSLAVLTVGLVEGLSPTSSLQCWRTKDYGAGITGSIPVPTTVVISGSIAYTAGTQGVQCDTVFPSGDGTGRIALPTAPSVSGSSNSATPTSSYECWKIKDFGAGVTGSIPVPPYVVTSGSIGYSAGTQGVHCDAVVSTGGGIERTPLPTAPPAMSSPTPISASSNKLPSRVLLPSIIVPICSVALIAIAAVLLRRHFKAKDVNNRKWSTLQEEDIKISNDRGVKPTNSMP